MDDKRMRKPSAKNVRIKSGAKVEGIKDDLSSLNLNHCRQAIGGARFPPSAAFEISKSGSGGSMVARLKLKGIDGRAPPGVEPAA